MQYCYLQHLTLLSPPDTSTAERHFQFDSLFIPSGAISPFFSSSILGTYQPGGFFFQCHIFLPFHTGYFINNLRYTDDTTLMAESKELKSLLIKVKEESGKVGFKLNIQKMKIMASSPTTLRQTGRETVTGFILGGSKITADDDRSHEIKRCLLLRKKAMVNLDSILKSRDITLSTKVCLVKAMVFPVDTYGCESWTIDKAEC